MFRIWGLMCIKTTVPARMVLGLARTAEAIHGFWTMKMMPLARETVIGSIAVIADSPNVKQSTQPATITVMAEQKVDSKRIGFALGGIQTAATGKSELLTASSMTVSAGATLPLSYDAVVSASSAAINEQVLTIVFVVGWA